MIVIGHRGAMAYEPENTLRSFARAIEQGADALEFDLSILPTGEIVAMHDRHVDRTTNGHGYLNHFSFRELRKLDAGKGERIPTFQEILDLADRRVMIIVEIKSANTAKAVADCIEDYVTHHGWSYDQFIVSSFNHPEILAFKTKHAAHLNIAASMATIPLDMATFAEALQAMAIIPDIDFIDEALIEDAHARGLKVFTYTIDSYEDTLLMHYMGVDGVFSNSPDISVEALRHGNNNGLRPA